MAEFLNPVTLNLRHCAKKIRALAFSFFRFCHNKVGREDRSALWLRTQGTESNSVPL
jgi:hypothetical protein